MSENSYSGISDSDLSGKHFAARVREASRDGRLVALESVWRGSEADFIVWKQSQTAPCMDDIMLVREGDQAYLYSALHMSESYAEAVARAGCKDVCWAVVQTVRSESKTYPRPTALDSFREPPFRFSGDSLERALREISFNPDYMDIRQVRSSDGSIFLFSSIYMDPGHAEALAEWIAVGRLQNP